MVFYIVGQYGEWNVGLVDGLGKDPQEVLRGKGIDKRIGDKMIAIIPTQEFGIKAGAKGQKG